MQVANHYGIHQIYSMTWPHEMDRVRSVLGDRIRFIAIPDLFSQDPVRAVGTEYQQLLPTLHQKGVRIAKFWAAPRGRDIAERTGSSRDAMSLGASHVQDSMQVAVDLGMAIMVHIADPDTWFQTKYSNATKYGSKSDQYEALEMSLEKHISTPFIAAHFGGWPENLAFLSRLLSRHQNLYLDTSAAKWMIRELSKHTRDDLIRFLVRWKGRVLFGSDIVTMNSHLSSSDNDAEAGKAADADSAFDLYASRYWMLRKLFESNYHDESPVADPDLAMVDPDNYSEFDAPDLNGMSLPSEILCNLYHDAARDLLEPLYK